jgi:hypothetical protein
MAATITLGGKSPADKKKKPMPSLLMVSMGKAPKDDAPPSETEDTPKPPTSASPEPPKPGGGVENDPAPKTPGASWFVNQDETCAKCEYFDDAGNNGVGACKKGVPEADYSKSDPTASRCRFFEANESPVEQKAEGEMPEMPGMPSGEAQE